MYFILAALWMAAELVTSMVNRDSLSKYVKEFADLGTPVLFAAMIFSSALNGLFWPFWAIVWCIRLLPPTTLKKFAAWLRKKAEELDRKHNKT